MVVTNFLVESARDSLVAVRVAKEVELGRLVVSVLLNDWTTTEGDETMVVNGPVDLTTLGANTFTTWPPPFGLAKVKP